MPTLNINNLLTYMENNNASLEESLKAYKLDEKLLTPTVRAEIERQMELHNANIAKNQTQELFEAEQSGEFYRTISKRK